MSVKGSGELLVGNEDAGGGDDDFGAGFELRVLTRRLFDGDDWTALDGTTTYGDDDDSAGVWDRVCAGTEVLLVSTKLLRTSSLRHERKML
jgi:hypothetical protein